MTVNLKKSFMFIISLIIMFTLAASNFVFAIKDSILGVADITPIEVEYNSDSGQFYIKDGEIVIFDDSLDLQIKNFKVFYFDVPGGPIPSCFISLEQRSYKDLDLGVINIKMFFTGQLEKWIRAQTKGGLPVDLDLSVKAELCLKGDDGQHYHSQVDMANIKIIGSESSLVEEIASYTRRPSLGDIVILSSTQPHKG